MSSWERESSGWIHHNAGKPWWQVQLPLGLWSEPWFRLTHRCKPWTIGVHGWEVTQYCACGAVRFGELAFWTTGMAWNPVKGPPEPEISSLGSWLNRNSRYLGTAMHYEPHLRPIEGA